MSDKTDHDADEPVGDLGGLMSILKTSSAVGAVGILLGFVMVWWVEPATTAGAIFLVVATGLICFAATTPMKYLIALIKGKPKTIMKNKAARS